jgi:hypothetical protein
MLVLLQTRGVFNDNELNMCDECHKKKNIYVIIKLQMYVLLYKNKHITKKIEIFKKFESYCQTN